MTLSAATRRRLALATATSLVLGTAGALAVATPAMAATYTVDSLTDDGVGDTLREAIALANANPGGDTITFAPSLSGGILEIGSVLSVTESLVITGLGKASLFIERTVASSDFFAFDPAAAGQDFTLSGITFLGVAAVTGTAVVANDNTLPAPRNVTITDVSFEQLLTTAIGGSAINVDGITGTLAISNSKFTGNTGGGVSGAGGAVSAVDVGTAITITNSEFLGNQMTTGFGGGAVSISSALATVTITDSTFNYNDANPNGSSGAVRVVGSNGVTVTGGSFTNNESYNGGGAILVLFSDFLSITGTLFDNNTSTDNRGGAVFFADAAGSLTVSGATFTNNTALYGAGALGISDTAQVVVQDSTFRDNSTPENGGAIEILNSDGTYSIERSTFEGNEAGGRGGGVYVERIFSPGTVSVHSSTFIDNVVGASDGAALTFDDIDNDVTVINSTFDEDPSSVAIVGTADGGPLRIKYSTVFGGVLVEDLSRPVEILSSIVVGGVVVSGGGSVDVSYSLLSSALNGDIDDLGNNLFSVADMKLGPLQSNGGPTFTRLPLAGSPAIDRGFPGGTPPTFDQRYTGFPRVLGGRVDIGSVESGILADTGATINPVIPIAGGVLLLGGIAALVVAGVRRRSH